MRRSLTSTHSCRYDYAQLETIHAIDRESETLHVIPPMTRCRVLALVAAAMLAAAGAACSDDTQPQVAEGDFAQRLTNDIEGAEAAGATAEQIQILEEALRTGEISFEAYDEAINRALRCLREAGVAASDGGVADVAGVKLRSYSVPVDAEEADGREPVPGYSAHRCVAEHSFWVERAYQLQPASIEAQEAYYEQFREPFLECLREQGIELDPDEAIALIVRESDEAYLEDRIDVSCRNEVGM